MVKLYCEVKMKDIKDIIINWFLTEEQQNSRLDICKACDKYNKSASMCKVCKCYIPWKIPLPAAVCPEGKWSMMLDPPTKKD